MFTKEWLRATTARALHTFAQSAIGMITVGYAISDIDWRHVVSVCAVAMLISILKSIVAGTPESRIDGSVTITDTDDGAEYKFSLDPAKIQNGKTLRLNVVDTADNK